MAKKYVISATASEKIAAISAALTDYYGAGVTIYGTDASNIVFGVPAISSRVLKFTTAGYLYSGSGWSSGVTITDSITLESPYGNYSPASVPLYLILSDTTIYLTWLNSGRYDILITKLSNGISVGIGGCSENNATYYNGVGGKNLADGALISYAPLDARVPYKFPDAKLLTYPVYFQDSTNILLVNEDGTPAYVQDMKQCPPYASVYDASNIFINSQSRCLNNYASYGLNSNGFFFELTP